MQCLQDRKVVESWTANTRSHVSYVMSRAEINRIVRGSVIDHHVDPAELLVDVGERSFDFNLHRQISILRKHADEALLLIDPNDGSPSRRTRSAVAAPMPPAAPAMTHTLPDKRARSDEPAATERVVPSSIGTGHRPGVAGQPQHVDVVEHRQPALRLGQRSSLRRSHRGRSWRTGKTADHRPNAFTMFEACADWPSGGRPRRSSVVRSSE